MTYSIHTAQLDMYHWCTLVLIGYVLAEMCRSEVLFVSTVIHHRCLSVWTCEVSLFFMCLAGAAVAAGDYLVAMWLQVMCLVEMCWDCFTEMNVSRYHHRTPRRRQSTYSNIADSWWISRYHRVLVKLHTLPMITSLVVCSKSAWTFLLLWVERFIKV